MLGRWRQRGNQQQFSQFASQPVSYGPFIFISRSRPHYRLQRDDPECEKTATDDIACFSRIPRLYAARSRAHVQQARPSPYLSLYYSFLTHSLQDKKPCSLPACLLPIFQLASLVPIVAAAICTDRSLHLLLFTPVTLAPLLPPLACCKGLIIRLYFKGGVK